MTKHFLAALVLVGLVAVSGSARVVDSAPNGFVVNVKVNVSAAPDEAYRKVVRNVGDWWNSLHTFSQNAHNLSIDDKPQGCFCEKLPNNGGVRHLEVVYVSPGKIIRMTGGLGPMQGVGMFGVLTISFSAAQGGGTDVDVTYAAGGYFPAGLNTFAAPADGMLTEQFTRFKNYVEKGDPAPK